MLGLLVVATAACGSSDEPAAPTTTTAPIVSETSPTTTEAATPTTTAVVYPDGATVEQKLTVLTALSQEGLCGLWQAGTAMSTIPTETSEEFEAKLLASVALYDRVADVVAEESEPQAASIRAALQALATRAEAEGYPVSITQGPVEELNQPGFQEGTATFDRIASAECAAPAD